MTPVFIAAFAAAVNLLSTGVAGAAVGWFICLPFRLKWRGRDLFLDALVAACVALVFVFLVSTYNAFREALPIGMPLMIGGGVLGVVVRHAIRLMLKTVAHGRV
jgi:hypothetical protein